MITGDNINTAVAMALQSGIFHDIKNIRFLEGNFNQIQIKNANF